MDFETFDWSVLQQLKMNPSPQFKPGDEVWVIHHKEIHRAKVRSVIIQICQHEKNFAAILTGYDLGLYHTVGLNFTTEYFPYEIFATREEARKSGVWHSVRIPHHVWFKALGAHGRHKLDKKRAERFNEKAEFGTCCADIDQIRELLFDCHAEKGMMERDRTALQHLLQNGGCGHVTVHPLSQKPNLALILKALKITVPDPTPRATSA